MRSLTPIPLSLSTVFTVREALDEGMSRDQLRSQRFDARVWGVRMPRNANFHARARAALLGCGRNAFLCGPTAAVAHGIPVPWRVHPDRRGDELDIATPGPGRAVRRNGIRARSLRVQPFEVVDIDGIRVMSPARTWCDLVRWCSLPELVAVADWLYRNDASSASQLGAILAGLRDRRGITRLRGGLELVDPAAESPKESELRTLVALAGLPPVRVNHSIVVDGAVIARVDLLFESYGEVLEYQGDHHRTDLHQWRRDRTRESELESLGYHVTEVTEADLRSSTAARALMTRIARNLQRRGWRGDLAYSPWFP